MRISQEAFDNNLVRDACVKLLLLGMKEFGITQRNADGETRVYESELHPRQPTYDISVN
jgi:hypothetical protein